MLLDAQIPVQTALLSKLSSATYISNNSIPVLDSAEKGKALPYINIGDLTVVNDSTQGIGLQTLTGVIHTWTEGLSSLQLKETMAAVMLALDDVSLTLASPFTHISTKFLSSNVLNDPDGFTKHGVQRFRIQVQNS